MRKILKIVGYILAVIVILVFGAQLWLGHKIRTTIEKEISGKTAGALRVEIGRVDVRFIGRTVRLKNIDIIPVTTDSLSPSVNLSGHVNEITLQGIRWSEQDTTVVVHAGRLKVDIRDLSGRGERSEYGGNIGSWEMKNIPWGLQLGEVELRLGNACYEEWTGQDTTSMMLTELHCRMEDWKWCPDSIHFPVSWRDMQMSLAEFQGLFDGGSQLLEIDSLALMGKESIISVAALKLLPQYPMEVFALKNKRHSDWTQVQTGEIACFNFDIQEMMATQMLRIDSIVIRSADIKSFKNRQVEQPKRVKRLFYELVQQFPVPVSVRTIVLNDMQVEYQELAQKGVSPGGIRFSQLEGVFRGLTNIMTSDHSYYTLQTSGKLMGQGDIAVTFFLPVDSLNPRFEVMGNLGKMDMLFLNPIIEPLVKVKIDSGEVDKMSFRITGNQSEAEIELEFLYHDLKVTVQRYKDGELKVTSFFTKLVNGIIIDKNNPGMGRIRKVEAVAERDVYRSQFNYLWRTLLTGLKKSVLAS